MAREPLLPIHEVAWLLNVSTRTVHRLITAGTLIAVQVGKRRKVSPAAVNAYLAAQRVQPETSVPPSPRYGVRYRPETNELGGDRYVQ